MTKETFTFQAEVGKILDIVAHSLYSEKEVFLRELISNASDACDKLRYAAISDSSLMDNNSDFKIEIEANKKDKILILKDNGIGMSKEELIESLGTIAKSGTQAFMETLKNKDEKEVQSSLIGQFGVGFYSSFMVSDQVVVRSKKYDSSSSYLWTSDGKGTFSIEPTEFNMSGTEITLSIKKDEGEFLSKYRIEEIVKKVSEISSVPEKEIVGKSRKMEIAQARQVSMFLSREILGKSLSGIGMYFGGRDHLSLIHISEPTRPY